MGGREMGGFELEAKNVALGSPMTPTIRLPVSSGNLMGLPLPIGRRS